MNSEEVGDLMEESGPSLLLQSMATRAMDLADWAEDKKDAAFWKAFASKLDVLEEWVAERHGR